MTEADIFALVSKAQEFDQIKVKFIFFIAVKKHTKTLEQK